jgi:hypothetical protein
METDFKGVQTALIEKAAAMGCAVDFREPLYLTSTDPKNRSFV